MTIINISDQQVSDMISVADKANLAASKAIRAADKATAAAAAFYLTPALNL